MLLWSLQIIPRSAAIPLENQKPAEGGDLPITPPDVVAQGSVRQVRVPVHDRGMIPQNVARPSLFEICDHLLHVVARQGAWHEVVEASWIGSIGQDVGSWIDRIGEKWLARG